MKFSIIIPTYNSLKWIEESVNSVLCQSLNDFELIIVDSGSTDNTLNWISLLHDKRIKIYSTDKKLSIEENWSRIKEIPKKEFMTILGHDDILYPDYLATMDNLINQHPDASLYQSHFQFIDSSGKIIRSCRSMNEIETGSGFLQSVLLNKIDITGTGFMMRSKDFDLIGGVPVYPNLLFSDFQLWIEAVRIKGKVAISKETTFAYRRHASVAGTSDDKIYANAFKQFIRYLLKLKSEDKKMANIINDNGIEFINNFCRGTVHRMLRVSFNQRRSVNDFIDICKNCADELIPGNDYHPEKTFSIRLAKIIDSNALTRSLFLNFKKIYKTPVLNG